MSATDWASLNWTGIAWILAAGYVLGQVVLGVWQVKRFKLETDARLDEWRKGFERGVARATDSSADDLREYWLDGPGSEPLAIQSPSWRQRLSRRGPSTGA